MLSIVAKLSERLKENKVEFSQLKREKCERLGIEYEEPKDLVMDQIKKAGPEFEAELTTQLSHHVLGPLFEDYETTIALLRKDLE